MGRQSSDRRCRGCVYVLGRSGGRLRHSNRDGGTSDGGCDVSDQVLYPLLCGWPPVLRVFVSKAGKHGSETKLCHGFSENLSRVSRANVRQYCRRLSLRHQLQERCVHRRCPAGSLVMMDLFRVSSGNKGFHPKFLRRFLKVKSNVKRRTFGPGKISY